MIGTGFGGSAIARRLAGRARVLVLEKGRRWDPESFRQSLDPRYLNEVFDLYPGCGTGIVTGSGVGGGSLIYSMVSLRAPSAAFDWTDRAGLRFWPDEFSRASLDSLYEKVEREIGVTQLEWVRPPAPEDAWKTVSARDIVFARGLAAIGRSCDALPLALSGCRDCGFCTVGCRFGAKQSLDRTYLARAEAEGAEIRPRVRVERIGTAPGGGYRARYMDLDGGDRRVVEAPLLVVAAGAMGTAGLLLDALRHKTLPRLSGQAGRNLSLNGDLALGGYVPDHTTEEFHGKIDGSITYAWWDRDFTLQCVRLPIAVLAGDSTPFPIPDAEGRRWGMAYKERMRDLPRHLLPIGVLGRDDAEGVVRLAPDGTPYVNFRPSARTRGMWKESIDASREIVERGLGGKLLPTAPETHGLLGTVHPLGTARIADGPHRGVVGPDCEAFGHPGLFVVDGAAVPGPIGVNTSLTIAAVAERASGFLLERLTA